MSIQLARVNRALKKPAGTPWPETFTPKQIAHFAAWRGDEPDPHWSARAAPLLDALHTACLRGELASTTSAVRVPAPGLHVRNTGYPNFIRKPTPTVEATVRHIAAAPLAAWLEAQHVQPGELLLAWFEAQGVGVGVEQPAPAVESAEARGDRRLRMCVDAGLPMDKAAIHRLPDGGIVGVKKAEEAAKVANAIGHGLSVLEAQPKDPKAIAELESMVDALMKSM